MGEKKEMELSTQAIMDVTTIDKLVNAELKVQMNLIHEALVMGVKQTWIQAIAIAEIVTSKLFVDDFKTITNFSKFVGVSQGRISQIVKAVEFMREQHFIPTVVSDDGSIVIEYDDIPYTVDTAYLLSTLKDKAYALLMEKVIEDDIDISSLPQSEVKKLVASYKPDKGKKIKTREEIESNLDGDKDLAYVDTDSIVVKDKESGTVPEEELDLFDTSKEDESVLVDKIENYPIKAQEALKEIYDLMMSCDVNPYMVMNYYKLMQMQ